MEQAVLHLVHIAAWVFFIIFILALIGLIAIVRWVMNLFRRTEAAVEGGVEKVEGSFRR
jgi:Trk-type K+ transport system membrane component